MMVRATYGSDMIVTYSFTGTVLRGYVDSVLVTSVEVAGPLRRLQEQFDHEFEEKKSKLASDEAKEKELLKVKVQQDSDNYFRTKTGRNSFHRKLCNSCRLEQVV
jgi:hypothetical protein